jgi:polyhydroxyalkanoate synthesis regulator phasin
MSKIVPEFVDAIFRKGEGSMNDEARKVIEREVKRARSVVEDAQRRTKSVELDLQVLRDEEAALRSRLERLEEALRDD